MLFVNIPTFSTAIGFEIGMRDARHFENLSEKTSHVNPKKYVTDRRYVSYILIDTVRKLIGKAHPLYFRTYKSVVATLLNTFCTKNLLPTKESL